MKFMRSFRAGVVLGLAAMLLGISSCRKAEPFPEDDYDTRLSGGAATIFDESARAFTHPISGMSAADSRAHEMGDAAFEATFVSAPALINGGLGPIYNNVSCISCHHNDGKGTPTAGQVNSSLLFRISTPGMDDFGGPAAVAGYGGQLQDRALVGVQPEGKVTITYSSETVSYPDGSTVTLRKPDYVLGNTYVALPAGCEISPRLAPPVFGLGLLELIDESTLKGMADEHDSDGDGISGRINYVWNPQTKQREPGRFGLKASVPSIAIQVAGAYNQDIGVTNSIFPIESSHGQSQFDSRFKGVELADSLLNAAIFYIRTLAVPARRDVTNPVVKQGELLFQQIGCAGCHKPVLQTGIDQRLPFLSNQRIQPFTDLLVHDMGPGLADNRPDYMATGSEWRTMPLWGVGLFPRTNGTAYYLHDGRARSLEEAILWHGGEAEGAKQRFMQLSKSDRSALIRFLESL